MDRSERPCTISIWRDSEGKGTSGCLITILLLGVAVFVAINAGPPYMASKSLEGDLKAAVSRAGARYYSNDLLMKEVLELAKKNEVRITAQNVKIERYAGQIFVKVRYDESIDLMLYEYVLKVDIKVSSYIGTL